MKFKRRKKNPDKKMKLFLKEHIVRRHQRASVEEKIIKFFILIVLRIAVRPHHWKDKRRNKEIIVKTYQKIASQNFWYTPPAFAFYLITAFMPLISITILILSTFPVSIENYFNEQFLKFIAIDISTIRSEFDITNLFSQAWGTILIVLSSFWIGSAGFAKFVFTASHIYEHNKFGGFWMNRLRGASIIFGIAFWFVFGITIFSIIPQFLDFINLSADSGIYKFFYYTGNLGWGFLFLYFGLVLLFKFAPRFKLTWRQVHPGAVIATTPTLLFFILIFFLSRYIFNYAQFGIIAPMLTLSFLMSVFSYFIYVGLIANASFYKTHHKNYTISKITLSKK